MPDRDLTDAALSLVNRRMAQDGISVLKLAGLVGMDQSTLNRNLKGRGTLNLDEWHAVASALGWTDLEGLVEAARRTV